MTQSDKQKRTEEMLRKHRVLRLTLVALILIGMGAGRALRFAAPVAYAALIFALIFHWLGVTIVIP